MGIIRCTSVGIKLTDGSIIPAVRVVLSTDKLNYTAVEKKELQTELLQKAGGCIATCGYFTSRSSYIHEFDSYFPKGMNIVRGNISGFSLNERVNNSDSYRNIIFHLSFQDRVCGYAEALTGLYFEYVPMLIYTDENYNLYTVDTNFQSIGALRWLGFNQSTATPLPISYSQTSETLVFNIDSSYTPEPREANYNMSLISIGNIKDYISGEIDPTDNDPYIPGGISGPGGGDGTFDFTSTDIPIPGLPTIGAFDCGFTSLFRPSQSEIKALADYMWAGTFDIENLRKIVANPMDVIMGLYIIPTYSGHPSAVSSQLVVGNISTGLSMAKLTEQYYEVDCGTIQVLNKWGAYFDYFPYSKLSLYLPYIGYVPLSPDDCMGGSIHVIYHVDVMGGTCTAFVYCTSNRGTAGHTLYTFNGSCAVSCPITAGQYASIFDFISNAATAAFSMAMGKPDMLSQVQNAIRDSVTPEVSRSGDFGGSGGLMGIQYPYLILTVPNKVNPAQQNKFRGYPSFVTKTIGDVTGYNEFEVTHLNNMTCTSQEAEEIMSLLRSGVIL